MENLMNILKMFEQGARTKSSCIVYNFILYHVKNKMLKSGNKRQ